MLRRPGHEWPLIVAENRDERTRRQSKAPGRHWNSEPNIIAGQDVTSPMRGTWIGANDDHVFATIVNTTGTTGKYHGLKSRSSLVMDALRKPTATAAKDTLMRLHADEYPPFFLVVGDRNDAYVITSNGAHIMAQPIPEGISMITPAGLNSPDCKRAEFQERFRHAMEPDPGRGEWGSWIELLAKPSTPGTFDAPTLAQAVHGMKTLSSTLIAFPKSRDKDMVFLYADGLPGKAPYLPVTLDSKKSSDRPR
jgi:uncharacterized protein with NRDE domain